jgi:beta-galactosidase
MNKKISTLSFLLALICLSFTSKERIAVFPVGNSNMALQDTVYNPVPYDSVTVNAPFLMPFIRVFRFPQQDFSIADFGAVEGGETNNSHAIAQAIDACNKAGGGRVIIPAGTWATGPIHFRSNVNLHLEENAILSFTDNPNDYLPAVMTSWEGMECYNYSPLVYAFNCENIAITGKGMLKPQMTTWKKWFPRPQAHLEALKKLYTMASTDVPVEQRRMAEGDNNLRPHLIHFNRCKNVLLDGFSIRESPFWTIHLYLCDGGLVRHLNVKAHGHNNDGIDFEMSRNFLVEHCTFDQGDDAVVIKSGRNRDAWRLNTPCENIVIRHCNVLAGHTLLGIGSELSGGIRNIYLHDCSAPKSVDRFFFIKTNHRRGGFVENIYMKNVTSGTTQRLLEIDTDVLYQWKTLVPTYEERITRIEGVHLENVYCETTDAIYELKGDAKLPVKNVEIRNIHVGMVKQFVKKAIHVENITEENMKYDKIHPSQFFDPSDLTITGVYYYPEHWDESQWERDLKQIKALGFDFVHYAEFAWAQLEPSEGVYNFAWLDRAIDMAARNGLKVIMCTSTATPPVWLVREHPDILIENESGTHADHGARQHPSVSNNYFRRYSLSMIDKLAQHYGNDTRIIGWQLDNEPRPAHDYGQDAQKRFRQWLKNKYRDIQPLNKAWGAAFWSQIYSSFDEINIPRLSQMFMNSHQILDYNRFSTEEMTSFLDEQTNTIRRHCGNNQWITTNYIPEYSDGHLRKSNELNFHSYTRYMVFGENYGIGRKGYRLGPVERIAKANDFFRTIDGVYGVMELQPGQVNWGRINPQPLPGAVRLWLWQVFSGGSRFVCTYRYRQPTYGTELYHYGIVGADGVTPTPGGLEYAGFIKEVKELRKHYSEGANNPAAYEKRRTGILYNHENAWEMSRNPQTSEWNTERHINHYYNALKSFGAPVDFLDERNNFSNYPVIIAPAYEMIDEELVKRWTTYVERGGNLVLTCRTGHKNRTGQLFEAPFAAPIYSLIGAKIDFYDLLLPQTPDNVVFDRQKYLWTSWGEVLIPENDTETWATYSGDFYEGRPAITFRRLGKGTLTYIGVDSRDGQMEKAVLKKLYARLSIPLQDLPAGLHIEYRDGFGIAVNYADKTYTLPLQANTKYIIGGKNISCAGVSVWKE